jgi:hypothetical protein
LIIIKKLLILAFLLLTGTSFAQTVEYAPIGATWYTTINSWDSDDIYSSKIIVEKDTIIQGIVCKKLKALNPHDYGCGNGYLSQFTYKSNDTVYFYNRLSEKFHMYYDLGANVGDSWDIVFINEMENRLDTLKIVVDSIRVIPLSGHLLRNLYTSQPNVQSDNYFYSWRIIEGVGTDQMLPDIKYCDPPTGSIRCFISNELNIHFWDDSLPCDYTNVSVNTIENRSISLYPNPATNFITIQSQNNQFIVFEIRDISGMILKKGAIQDNSINVSDFDQGIYFVRIIRQDELPNIYYELKFIKE